VPVAAGFLMNPMHSNYEIDATNENAHYRDWNPDGRHGKRCVNQSQDTREYHRDADKPQQIIFGRFLHIGTHRINHLLPIARNGSSCYGVSKVSNIEPTLPDATGAILSKVF
jgi:hypothetical protein